MWNIFKNKEPEKPREYVVVNLNARLRPMDRGDNYEDVLIDVLADQGLGEITGGGTLQFESGEIENCDIEIQVPDSSREVVDGIKKHFERIGVPRGSKLIVESTKEEIMFGDLEGLAIYLNGTDLDDQIYEECDSNHVYSELDRLVEGRGKVYSYWQGPTETAFYLYGHSFSEMKSLISELTDNYPLCQQCRITQIA